MSNTTEHATGIGSIKFLAAARALNNQFTNKMEFSCRLVLDANDKCVEHIRGINSAKITTKNAGEGQVNINFTSTFAPKVLNKDNEVLSGEEIPYFDGRTDTGTAAVTYKVVDYGDAKIIRLSGIKLLDLSIVEKEMRESSMDVTLEQLKNIT